MRKICVTGGANVDICGASFEELRAYDSNPGMIEIRFGGVGRNIAEICALIGQKVRFVTAFSSDFYGKEMKKDCEALGMDCSYAKISDAYPSSIYLAILDEKRDMRIAMSDMRILDELTPEDALNGVKDLDENDILVLDANLSETLLHELALKAGGLKAADPVSISKAKRFVPILDKLQIFKPNQFESASLTGITIVDEHDAVRSLNWFLERGVREVIISMADRGILLGTQEGKCWIRHRIIDLENATGGGDTFMGAYVCERLNGADPRASAVYALSAAVTAIEQNSVRKRQLNDAEVREGIASLNIEEKILL